MAIGKIGDIYAHHGITKEVKASGLEELWDKTLEETKNMNNDGIVFTNFVDFDMNWGHRRDVKGYAEGLMYFDKRLPEIIDVIDDDDIVVITADHGCDPTYMGSDHTRENVPVLIFGKNVNKENVGKKIGYDYINDVVLEHLNIV